MTGMKYIRFRDVQQLDKNKMTELMNTILSSSKPISVNHIINSNPDQPNNDVHAWFVEH